MGIILFNLKTYLDVEGSLAAAERLNGLKTNHEVVIAPPELSLYGLSKKEN